MVLYKCKLNMCSPLRGCAVLAHVFGQEGRYKMYKVTNRIKEDVYSIWDEDGENIIGLVSYYENGVRVTVYDSKDKAHTIRLKDGQIWYTSTESRVHKLNLHGKREIEKMFLGISLQFGISLPNKIILD